MPFAKVCEKRLSSGQLLLKKNL